MDGVEAMEMVGEEYIGHAGERRRIRPMMGMAPIRVMGHAVPQR